MTEQKTLLLIKPDAVKSKNIGNIISIIEENQFEILQLKMMTMEIKRAKKFYDVHKNKPFFPDLIEFMTSGPLVAIILERQNAIKHLRKICGNTDSTKAEPGTIRNLYGSDIQINAVHSSDSPQSAEYEIKTMFDFK